MGESLVLHVGISNRAHYLSHEESKRASARRRRQARNERGSVSPGGIPRPTPSCLTSLPPLISAWTAGRQPFGVPRKSCRSFINLDLVQASANRTPMSKTDEEASG